jgi:hypothetical protein
LWSGTANESPEDGDDGDGTTGDDDVDGDTMFVLVTKEGRACSTSWSHDQCYLVNRSIPEREF